jgi:phage terminase large subunit-like protein
MNINITTAGFDTESVCYRLYDYGRKVESGEIDDPTMFFRWWAAPDGCDYRDPAMWPLANPSYGVTVQAAFYEDELSKRRESEFRRYYLNQWVETETTWLPYGAWEACEVPGLELVDGAKTWLGWDASSKRDSTALVLVQKAGDRLRVKARIWERPTAPDGKPVEEWRVPRNEIIDYIRTCWRSRYRVRGIAFDPAFITWIAEDLANEGAPMFEWYQSDTRMVPATEGAYQAITAGELEHDGNPTLARHIRNAVAVSTSRGGHRLRKPHPGSPKYIDGAIALLMAVDLAMRDDAKDAAPVLPIGWSTDPEDDKNPPRFRGIRDREL